MKFIIFDTETTGLVLPAIAPLEKQPKIIELGVVLYDSATGETEDRNWLVNPGQQITAEITKITGIKDEDLEGKPSFAEVWEHARHMFAAADVAVAHNAPFDTAMINNEANRIGAQPVWPKEIVCTVQEHMHLKGRRLKLTELYEMATGKVLQQTHRASDDAAALLEALVALKFFEAFQ